ncbi:MAG: cytochrome c3 family protein [Paludibacteraceae bacterium]
MNLSFWKKNKAGPLEDEVLTKSQKGNKKRNWLLIGLIAVIAIGLLSGVTLKVTSTPQFCSSCHEMSPEFTTWEVTSHSKIACVTCHIPPGPVNLVKHKLASVQQLAEHITGKIPQPIAMNTIINNNVCEQCHSSMRKVTPSGDILIPHDKHLAQGIACVACHGGVAHGFVAERGLTGKEDYDTWTIAKADKVTKFDGLKTAMEVCLDCHDQVNQGKKPWLTNGGVEKTQEQRIAQSEENFKVAATATGQLHEKSQPAIVTTGTITMHPPITKCAGCHTAIPTPDSHHDQSWGTNHGVTARKDVDYCATCHSRQAERAQVTAATNVGDYARDNPFCTECHAKRPLGHLADRKAWLPAHPEVIKAKGAGNCLACHDIDKKDASKPKETNFQITTLPSINPVYCDQCHWFKDAKEIH